ncbi:MAG TPA: DinB family protein [Gemmatimonadaceae bacterium]|nr:DinB family protein [Gemmatimonadaceae bacterium]
MPTTRPTRDDAVDYYFTYINKVGDGDIRVLLREQLVDTLNFLGGIDTARSLERYEADKWSIREVVSHLNDTERVFVGRAFWFARGFDSEMPGMDQDVAVAHSNADNRDWIGHIDEFRAIRESTLAFFDNLTPEAWERRGIASGNPFTVRGLAYICAGHVTHHCDVIRTRYLKV